MSITIDSGSPQIFVVTGSGASSAAFNVGAGDLIVVQALGNGGSFSGTAPTDNAGNTYTALTINIGTFLIGQIWYCLSSVAKNSLIVSFPNGFAGLFAYVTAYSTSAGTWKYDSTTGNLFKEVDPGSSASFTSLTTPAGGVIVCSALMYAQRIATFSTVSPFTSEVNQAGNASTNAAMLFDSISASAQSGVTATANSSINEYFAILGASFYVQQGPINAVGASGETGAVNLGGSGAVVSKGRSAATGAAYAYSPKTWLFRDKGAPQRQFNAALTPAAPALTQVGDVLILQSMMNIGNVAASSLTVTGWTLLAPAAGDTTTKCIGVWARIATGSDSASVNWGTIGTDSLAWIVAYNPNGTVSLGSIVHAVAGLGVPLNENGGITYPSLTITIPGCLVLLCGTKNNVTASFNAVWNQVTGAGTFTIDQQATLNNFSPDLMAVTNSQIQTQPVSIASAIQNINVNESPSTPAYSSVALALAPVIQGPPAVGVSGSTGDVSLMVAGGVTALGVTGSAATVSLTPQQLLSAGAWSMGVVTLTSVTPGSFATVGDSGSTGAASATAVGAAVLLGDSGSTGVTTVTGQTPNLGMPGFAGTTGAARAVNVSPGAMQMIGVSGSASAAFVPPVAYPRLIIDIASVPYWQFLDPSGEFFYVPAGLTTRAVSIPVTGGSPFIWVNPTGTYASIVIVGGNIQTAAILGIVPPNQAPGTFVTGPSGTFLIDISSQAGTQVTVPPAATLKVTYAAAPQIWLLTN